MPGASQPEAPRCARPAAAAADEWGACGVRNDCAVWTGNPSGRGFTRKQDARRRKAWEGIVFRTNGLSNHRLEIECTPEKEAGQTGNVVAGVCADAQAVDVSEGRLRELRQKAEPQLRPVLRPSDFAEFDLPRAFRLVADMAAKVR